MKQESSEVTAVEGHSEMLFDAASSVSEDLLLGRYRSRLGAIFEDVLRSVHGGFLEGFKVCESPKSHRSARSVLDPKQQHISKRHLTLTPGRKPFTSP
jgi:hypothetical protein